LEDQAWALVWREEWDLKRRKIMTPDASARRRLTPEISHNEKRDLIVGSLRG
jgi:hypothetical protein